MLQPFLPSFESLLPPSPATRSLLQHGTETSSSWPLVLKMGGKKEHVGTPPHGSPCSHPAVGGQLEQASSPPLPLLSLRACPSTCGSLRETRLGNPHPCPDPCPGHRAGRLLALTSAQLPRPRSSFCTLCFSDPITFSVTQTPHVPQPLRLPGQPDSPAAEQQHTSHESHQPNVVQRPDTTLLYGPIVTNKYGGAVAKNPKGACVSVSQVCVPRAPRVHTQPVAGGL